MCLILVSPCFALTASLQQKLNAVTLMTAQDMASNAVSNLNLKNNTGKPITVYGLYLYGVAFITPGLNCQNGIGHAGENYRQYQGMAGGAATSVSFGVGQSVPVGQNYLYNMLYTYLYWTVQAGYAPTCALPGCSWSTDTTQYNWCFKLGAVSPDATYTYTPYPSNTIPYAWPANDVGDGYDYDLIPNIDDYTWIGPFTCNDKTLTCSTPVPQNQSFQST